MAQPYIGEIRMFAGNFAPLAWEFCNGQLLPISENEALFQLIGTTYGGDGESTFALPNLQSRVPLHMGNGPDGISYPLAQAAGTEQETLSTQQMPVHSHALVASTAFADQTSPAGNIPGQPAVAAMTPVGGSQPHDNTQPFLCVNYIISLFGIFPSPT